MKRQEVLGILHKHESELRKNFGVQSLSLFGSVARDEARPDSDVDLLVEFNRPVGLSGARWTWAPPAPCGQG
jgi:predicted nucleotidyltransferase